MQRNADIGLFTRPSKLNLWIKRMGRENVTLAILFADIANSTHLYETLGNKKARNLIGACLSLLSEVTSEYRGTVVKTIGDEIMCTFPNPNDAVEAAISMNQSLMDMPIDDPPGTFPPQYLCGDPTGAGYCGRRQRCLR